MEFIFKENYRNIKNEDLLKDIVKVSAKTNLKNITTSQYREFGKYGVSTIRKRFGSFLKGLELAGIQPSKMQIAQTNISIDDLKSDLLRVYAINNNQPFSCKFYDKNGKYGFKRYYSYFGNWGNALKSVNISLIGGSKHITNLDLFNEIQRIWELKGKQPTTNNIKSGLSKYSLNTYCRRFGSWNNALKEFVNFSNFETPYDNDKNITQNIPIKSFNIENKHKTQRDINLRLRFKVMQRDNFKCCICGRSPATTPNLILHVDHIKPYSKGGETIIDNLQTLCQDCNLGKSDVE